MREFISFLIVVSVVVCLGCYTENVDNYNGDSSYVPSVRLVRDGDFEYHFQWDEPLKEDRIVLIRVHQFGSWIHEVTSDNILTGRVLYHEFINPAISTRLILFRQGDFISEPEMLEGWHCLIEILPAHERNTLPLPATAAKFIYGPNNNDEDYQRILKEHPFKPYRLGKSSRITFDTELKPKCVPPYCQRL